MSTSERQAAHGLPPDDAFENHRHKHTRDRETITMIPCLRC